MAQPPQSQPIVNSHNDWDPLEEIIVGHPFHLHYSDDVSSRLFCPEGGMIGADEGMINPYRGPHDDLRQEMWEDHLGFVAQLESLGVVVRQPELMERPQQLVTPHWEALSGHSTMARDLAIVLGNEILESPGLLRARYFELDLFKEIFYDYFEQGARWTAAPRPRMRDQDFDYSYGLEHGWEGPVPETSRYEIMFDAPQILRLGRDLLFNCTIENHRMGARWLQRHLGDRYRVHVIEYVDDHLDCVMIGLRPGTLLVPRWLPWRECGLPKELLDWEIIEWDREDVVVEEAERWQLPILASQAIAFNLLSVDEKRVMVPAGQERIMDLLSRHGFEPIPVSWRHGRLIGGGFHCMTLDVRRRGGLQEYFQPRDWQPLG